MRVSDILTKIEKFILYGVVALFIIFVLPGFPSPFVVPKEIFALAGVCLALILWTAKIIYEGKASFYSGRFDTPVLLIMAAYLISGVVRTPNKMEAFFFPGTVTFVLISILLYFLVNQFDQKTKGGFLVALLASGILLSLSVLSTQLGLYAKISQLPAFMKDPSFNPVGGALPAALYLAVAFTLAAALAIKGKGWVKRIFFGVSGAVLILGVVILTQSLLPGKSQALALPSFQTSWEVTIESLKQSPIWGAGPGNYLSAFDLGKSLTYNQGDLWQVRFSTASNYYFTLITEVGLAGLAAFLILILKVYREFLKDLTKAPWEEVSIVLLLVAFAIFPSAPVLIFLLFALLAVFSGSEEKVSSVSAGRVPSVITASPIWIGVIALAFFGSKAVLAEHTFQKSITSLSENNANQTYNLMVSAINQNPYVDRYHSSLAQIDMALASSLAGKQNPTDTDRQAITSLVQESINEAKASVGLNVGRSENWQVLAQIYGNIISFAQGADQFAIQSYNQAISLDPFNPTLRIALGGIYYSLGRYDEAINSFNLAVLAKPDLANAHYNLAIAYREKKDYDNAITQMNNVLSLVKTGTPDYDLAKSTLNDLEKNKPLTTTSGTSNLTPPQPAATTNIKPPITLPQEATPPAATQ